MTLYQKLKKLNIDLSTIGLEHCDDDITYFCTPKGAKIIGWAGVDGIHYCTIRGFREMIFAVNPSNMPGEYVYPIAHNLEDLFGLLMSCGSMDAIEQTHLWDREQFESYVKENLPTEKQLSVMNVVKEKFGIEPIEDPFSYIKNLQEEFDYSRIKFPPKYYDVDMNPAAEPEPEQWKVTYDGGFWRSRGRAGREIPIKKDFYWGEERWYIPAVYVCSKGLVVDFCVDVDPDEIKDFIDKWELLNESNHCYSREQQEQMEKEHPLNAHFEADIILNGKKLQREQGYGVSWIPASCLNDEIQMGKEAKQVLEHYGLDQSRGWAIHRYSYRWAMKRTPAIKSLEIEMERMPVTVPGIHFLNPSVGDVINFIHPITGVEHTLEIIECENGKLEQHHFPNESMEYPGCYTSITYTLHPDLSGLDFMLRDYNEGDRPRLKNPNPGEFEPMAIASVGIIGSADGPTVVTLSNGKAAKPRVICSSLYFEQPRDIEWYLTFQVKMMDDIKVELIK